MEVASLSLDAGVAQHQGIAVQGDMDLGAGVRRGRSHVLSGAANGLRLTQGPGIQHLQDGGGNRTTVRTEATLACSTGRKTLQCDEV